MSIVSWLTVIVLAGCAHDAARAPWNGRTILPDGQSIAALNILANDEKSTQEVRAKAVFTLFAHHIRPGFSAAQVRAVLTDTNWVSETNLYGVYSLKGKVPVDWTFDNTVFCMHLFPEEMEKRWSPWVIYISLPNSMSEGPMRSQEEALAFLRGDTSLPGDPKLLEFALCFPDLDHGGRDIDRIERYAPQGLMVYDFRHPSNSTGAKAAGKQH